MSKHPRFYRPELDVLRCLAFFLVFFSHSGLFLSGWLLDARFAGAFGVCLFFFLSAYLITELLDREQESTGTVRLGAFYIRRMLRIWPLYFAVLLLDFLHLHITQPGVFTAGRLAAFLLLAGNWFVAAHGLIGSFSAPLWSISVEEQFYLVWPSVRRVGGRLGSVIFSGIALLCGYVALAVLCHTGDTGTRVWVNSFVQFQFFASGALTALLLRTRTPAISSWLRVPLFACGLFALLLAQHIFRAGTGTAHGQLSLALPGYLLANVGCFSIFLSFLGASILGRARPLVYLGKISYGLYVFHWGLITLCGKGLDALAIHLPAIQPFVLMIRFVVALTCTIVLAALSYRYFEAPILRFKRKYEVIRTRPA